MIKLGSLVNHIILDWPMLFLVHSPPWTFAPLSSFLTLPQTTQTSSKSIITRSKSPNTTSFNFGIFFEAFRRMAGMLPGVESARRRRLRGTSSGWNDPSSVVGSGLGSGRFRLSYDTHITPTSFLVRIVIKNLMYNCGFLKSFVFFFSKEVWWINQMKLRS